MSPQTTILEKNDEPIGPIQFLKDIIMHEMDVEEDRIFFGNEKFDAPKDRKMYVVIEFRHAVPYSVRSKLVNEAYGDNLTEAQDVSSREYYAVILLSRNWEAFNRKEEVQMALGGMYAQQVQEANSFQIARIQPAQELSELEATANLRRFDIDVSVLAAYTRTKALEYYNSFKIDAMTETMKAPEIAIVEE